MAILNLTKHNDIVDGLFRPLANCATVAAAAEWLATADLPLFVEARFRVEPSAPVPVAVQIAKYERRLKAIAKGCGRVVVHVERMHGMDNMFSAKLVK